MIQVESNNDSSMCGTIPGASPGQALWSCLIAAVMKLNYNKYRKNL